MYPDRSASNCIPMSPDASTLFIKACISESSKLAKNEKLVAYTEYKEDDFAELPFLIGIVMKRVEVMKLPISFTLEAYLAMCSLCNNPGKAIVFLIDCLTHYKDKLVTAELVADLYPWGFYGQEVFETIVDDFMKPRKVKWSEIY